MAEKGFSTTMPFKKPSCPSPYLLLKCHPHKMASSSSSRSSFWASSKKSFHSRREVCTHQSANGSFPNVAVFSSSLQFKQSSSYSTMLFRGNHTYNYADCIHPFSHWRLVVCTKAISRTSSAWMLQHHTSQMTSKGKHFPEGSVNFQRIEEGEKEVPRDLLYPNDLNAAPELTYNSYRVNPGVDWFGATMMLKEEKKAHCCKNKNIAVNLGNPHQDAILTSAQGQEAISTSAQDQKAILTNEQARLEDLQDGSTCENPKFHTIFSSSEMDYNGRERALWNSKQFSRDTVRLNAGSGALRSSVGLEHKVIDPLNRQISRPPFTPSSQGYKFPGNGGEHCIINEDRVSHLPPPTESERGNNHISFDNVNDLTPNCLREKKIFLTHLSPNGAQPNGSLSGKLSEERQETNLKLDSASDAIKTDVAEAQGIDQPHLRERLGRIYEKVLVVDNISAAKKIVRMLTNQYRHLVHACDTEVAKIDVKQETPVDHGEIICFSIYSGPEANFGNGKSCIWVDVLDGSSSLLAEFAPFFEDQSIKKVWHNFSFDNHVIENYGLKVSGFHADTMHMARLWDSSRQLEGGYSLEALTGDPYVMSGAKLCPDKELIGKVSMKTIFGRRKMKKDGSEGKLITIPPVEELQRVEREPWICYSALDSISTLKLYESLKSKLLQRKWILDGVHKGTMFDFYEEYWRPFGNLLVRMETEGMLVDRAYLAEVEKVAKAEQQVAANRFRNWASKYCADAKYMNVGSDAQLRQLFFGGTMNRKDPNESLPKEKDFKIPNVDKVIEEGKKTPTKYRKITLHSLGMDIKTEIYTAAGWPSVSGDALKTLAGKVSAEFDFTDETHLLQSDDNVGNLLRTVSDKISETKGGAASEGPDASAYGTAYDAFNGGQTGIEACHAIAALCEVCSIDSLISNFILPLQGSHISGRNGRIHCSLNINTETGRLSARRPNLQNQPALEKDRYKIRQAFIAAPGNSLIVADYGQLELRILAHLADCKSMLDAFKAGGDFHSRTAMNMYPHICEAVQQKHVLLEWHPQPGEDKPPVPLLKDAFASERRKAKMLNFSIAYGKTAVGLARDWKVSVKEAKETVDRWYSERQEVLQWQEKHKEEARKKRCVHTLLGRARWFPSISHATPYQKGHIERAAINTPVQGSAADVAMCAMLEILKNRHLKELGWRLLLQVHDEVILEGPTESAEVAKAIVVECMSKPFDGKNILKVDLSVDAKCAQNWYSAK